MPLDSRHNSHKHKHERLTQPTERRPNKVPLTKQVQHLKLRQLGQPWRQGLCSIWAKLVV